VAVRLADAPLCLDEFASTPTSQFPLEDTVSADNWCSHWNRAGVAKLDDEQIVNKNKQ
jgi:hypothetical protein